MTSEPWHNSVFETNRAHAESEIEDDPRDPGGLFAVVAEWSNQAPILMETEGFMTSIDAARDRAAKMAARKDMLRVCIVRLTYKSGNELALHDMKRMQK